MDKETREYLDQKYVVLARKEDLEKLRQETKSILQKLREESKNEALEWKQDFKTQLEELRKEWKGEFIPLQAGFSEGLNKMKTDTELLLRQSGQGLEPSVQRIREEMKALFDQSNQTLDQILLSVKEEGKKDLHRSIEETQSEMEGFKQGLINIQEQFKQVTAGVGNLSEKVQEGFTTIKEELGAMIKFSYADLERRLNSLEERMRVLEKIVLR